MKVKSAVKRLCGFCYVVRRGKTVWIKCQRYGRHTQRQGFHTLDRNFVAGDKQFCTCSSDTNLHMCNVDYGNKNLTLIELNSLELDLKNGDKDNLNAMFDSMDNKLI